MIIGFVGFGKVSKSLLRRIKSPDVKFITSHENRSRETLNQIKNENIQVLDTFREVAIKSDILISANSPKSALDVAKKYGRYCEGIYLDLNNISPDTTLAIDKHVKNLIDGAIIGKIDSENPILYIAGKRADELMFLDEYISTKKISENVGDVATLKLLRSSYTKTLSALLIESYEISKIRNLEAEFFEILALTEGDDFKEKSMSRIYNTLNNSKRKSEELEEIINYFDENDLVMVKAALRKISQ